MSLIKHSAWTHYSAEQIYQLVNEVEKYPEFLPWCQSTRVIETKEDTMLVQVGIAWMGLHKTFSTENQLFPHRRIIIRLVNGGFNHLEGIWQFNHAEQGGCRIDFTLDFSLKNKLTDFMLQPFIHSISTNLIHAFTERAKKIYGDLH